jgi:SAM-dependent methyltransferase
VTRSVDLYEEIAAEYYDASRHPTSANFRQASRQVLEAVLPDLVRPTSDLAEVGCGDSLLMAVVTATGAAFGSVTLMDSSRTMLGYSERWRQPGVELLLADAQEVPVADGSFDVVISILGDPYNTPRFWAETERIVRDGGHVLYTTPSFDWSLAFRGDSGRAVFDRSKGDDLAVQSIVVDVEAQHRMIEQAGLAPVRQINVPLDDLVGPISPKLHVLPSPQSSVVTAYLARKPPR